MPLLTVKDLSLGYDSCRIIENLNFSVDEGDYLCIVGENGSGKTTLMKTILKLQKPCGGEIIVSDGLRANEIGYLPQQTFVQRDFPASVKEIVLSGCQSSLGLKLFYGKREKALAEENMKKMGIPELKNRCYRELSGGQQQRVLLARALCATKKLLLLDEPVAGLDPQVTHDMYETIAELNNEGMTIIMITHDINSAITYSSHVLHIGKDIFFGSKSEYLLSAQGQRFAGKEAVYA
jgi:zinc transport system ATP-binding protein